MSFKSIVFFSAALALLQLSLAFELGDYKAVAIRNRKDDTFLTAMHDKEDSCHKREKVITVHNSADHCSKGQEWKLYQDEDEKEDKEKEEKFFLLGEFDNEVTFANASYGHPVLAAYELIGVSEHFQIKRIKEQRCLTGNGDGEHVSWTKCYRNKRSRRFKKQFWYIANDEENHK